MFSRDAQTKIAITKAESYQDPSQVIAAMLKEIALSLALIADAKASR